MTIPIITFGMLLLFALLRLYLGVHHENLEQTVTGAVFSVFTGLLLVLSIVIERIKKK